MKLLVARERARGETRVAATPETVKHLIELGLEVVVEAGAGEASFVSDAEFEAAGATIERDPDSAWKSAKLVLTVRGPGTDNVDTVSLLEPGSTVIGFLSPFENADVVRRLADGRVTSLAMELVPRITRAQKMDALSSQANIAGYKAVLTAAAELPRYFPLLMTAAGTIKPAHVVILGAGVAGLQAIATARRLGAVVEASDIRPAVKEQVMSLGARFIEPPASEEAGEAEGGYAREVSKEYLAKQQEVVAERCAAANVVITTALVPGRAAPRLVTAATVERMRAGSVIVDLAAAQGGNCELTEADRNVRKHGVLLIGNTNLPATVPADASMVYARNVLALVQHLVRDGALELDTGDEITAGTLLTHAGQVVHAATAERLGVEPGKLETPAAASESGAGSAEKEASG